MQQKIQFIITILHRPGLLIFDEPFSGFDPINANLLKNEIIQLKENGTSIIFSTHNMNSVEELCDHIALVNKGRLVLKGAVNNLKNKYKTGNFSVSLRGDKPIPATEGVEVIKEKNETTGKSITIKPDNKKNINNYITALMKTHEVISFQENLPGMEEIFIRAVENKLEP
jgi:ABC-2 type transport system ATP-binding protein